MMGLQVFFQEVGGVAFSCGVTDEDNLIRRSDILRDLLIKRILFGHALATIVSFLSMNQMMMEIERIVRSHLVFICRTTSSEILVNMCGNIKNPGCLPTRNSNSSSPCGWTSPRCSKSSTASLQLRLWGRLPLRRFWYSDSRCLLIPS